MLVGLELNFLSFHHFEIATNSVLLLNPFLLGFLVSLSVQLTKKMLLGEITECWAPSSVPRFSLGSCPSNSWLRGHTELQVLSLQLVGLPNLCWLLYLLAASFLFGSQILLHAKHWHMLQGEKRCAEIWAHLSEPPFCLGCAFSSPGCLGRSLMPLRQKVLVFYPTSLLLRSTISYSITAEKFLPL